MRQKYRRIILLFASLSILSCVSMKTYAADLTRDLSIEINYSENLVPKEGDVFVVTCINTMDGTEKEITFDASLYVDDDYKEELPSGSYIIEDIVYEGENADISDSGYAITGSFDLTEEGDMLQLGIGYEEGTSIIESYDDYVVHQWDQKVAELEKTAISDNEEENKEDNESDIALTSADDISLSDNENKDNQIEAKSKNQDESKKELLMRGVPILILGVVGSIVIYILYKKGKID